MCIASTCSGNSPNAAASPPSPRPPAARRRRCRSSSRCSSARPACRSPNAAAAASCSRAPGTPSPAAPPTSPIALERATALWDEFRNHPSGEVTLLTFPTVGATLLPSVIADLSSVAGLVVRATDLDPELAEFADLTNDYDIVLAHTMPGELPWGGRGLRAVPLLSEPLDIGLPADHRLAARSHLTPADLVDETWLGVPPGFPFERILHAVEQQGGRRVDVSQRFSDMRIIEAFIEAGLGIAFVPRYTSGNVPSGMVLKPLRGITSTRRSRCCAGCRGAPRRAHRCST